MDSVVYDVETPPGRVKAFKKETDGGIVDFL
jgi:hypothetical protein